MNGDLLAVKIAQELVLLVFCTKDGRKRWGICLVNGPPSLILPLFWAGYLLYYSHPVRTSKGNRHNRTHCPSSAIKSFSFISSPTSLPSSSRQQHAISSTEATCHLLHGSRVNKGATVWLPSIATAADNGESSAYRQLSSGIGISVCLSDHRLLIRPGFLCQAQWLHRLDQEFAPLPPQMPRRYSLLSVDEAPSISAEKPNPDPSPISILTTPSLI